MIIAFKIGFLSVGFKDIMDIFLVSLLLFQVYKLIHGTVAIRVFIGFLTLYLIYLVVDALQMELLSTILGQFMGVGVLAAIILFHQEIRKFLLMLGKTNLLEDGKIIKSVRFWSSAVKNENYNISAIEDAVKELSDASMGAIIVLSAESPLKFYAESGDTLDCLISKRLFLSIFNKYSPLHDGATIVHKGRIVASRCILPVSEQDNIPAHFGLRHRAALGMSENTAALVIVVSEETGSISIIQNGNIDYNISIANLRKTLNTYLNQVKIPSI